MAELSTRVKRNIRNKEAHFRTWRSYTMEKTRKQYKLKHIKSKTRIRKDKSDFEKELSKQVKTNSRNISQKHHKQKACQRAFRAGRWSQHSRSTCRRHSYSKRITSL